MQQLVDENLDQEDLREWLEISRADALTKIERCQTEDLVAFEIERFTEVTPLGEFITFTWFLCDDFGEQQPILLCMRDPASSEALPRWFIHSSLVDPTDLGS